MTRVGDTDETAVAGLDLDGAVGESLRRVLAQLRLEHREELGPGLDQGDPRVLFGDVAVVLGEVPAVELGDRAGGLDPGRPSADDDDVQGAVRDEARVPVGGLPALEQVILEADGVRQRVHREGVLRRPLGPEEVDLGAEAEDEVVVGDRREPVEGDLARVEVDRGDARLVDGRVVLALEQVAERVSDRGRLEQAGGELVEQRLEGVVVVPVDEHDLGVRVLQLLRGADPGEASAEDQDAWPFAGGAHDGEIPQAAVVDSPGSRRISDVAGPEGVRRAGHRLDREAAAVHVGSGCRR